MVIRPFTQQTTWSPGVPMTRLMKTFSLGSERQDTGELKTITSPRCGSRKS